MRRPYVRSKQNVRDKVGLLGDNDGNIITHRFLMAEELNMHFSSVFTRGDTSSLPVPETKFNGSEGERLGQLIVTPEVVASKINDMKEGNSSVTRVTFYNFWTLKSNILFTILLFSNPSCVCW